MSDAENPNPFEDFPDADAPEAHMTPLDRDRLRLQGMDADIREAEIGLARLKEERRRFYIETKQSERRPSLTEMNEKAKSIGRVEQRRKVRVVEELAKMSGSMNMTGPRPKHPPVHPAVRAAAEAAARSKES